jgi:hypothetical protein
VQKGSKRMTLELIKREDPIEDHFLLINHYREKAEFIPAYNRAMKRIVRLGQEFGFKEKYGFEIDSLYGAPLLKEDGEIHYGLINLSVDAELKKNVLEILKEDLNEFGVVDELSIKE